MPLTANTPKEVRGALVANYFVITGFKALLKEGDISVYYDYGNEDAATGEITIINSSVFKLKIEDFKLTMAIAPTKPLYDNIKGILYTAGQKAGVFPEGTID